MLSKFLTQNSRLLQNRTQRYMYQTKSLINLKTVKPSLRIAWKISFKKFRAKIIKEIVIWRTWGSTTTFRTSLSISLTKKELMANSTKCRFGEEETMKTGRSTIQVSKMINTNLNSKRKKKSSLPSWDLERKELNLTLWKQGTYLTQLKTKTIRMVMTMQKIKMKRYKKKLKSLDISHHENYRIHLNLRPKSKRGSSKLGRMHSLSILTFQKIGSSKTNQLHINMCWGQETTLKW